MEDDSFGDGSVVVRTGIHHDGRTALVMVNGALTVQIYQDKILQHHVVPLIKRERERIFLFNNALNTFYLRLYGVRHMVKDHSDSEKGNLLSPHRLLLSINSKGSFICTIPQTG